MFTFSRSAVKYLTSQIDTITWTYVREWDATINITDISDDGSSFDDFGNFKAKLQQDDGEEADEEEEDPEPFNDPEFYFEWDGCEVQSEIPTSYK